MPQKGRKFLCLDCNEDTSELKEHYFIHTELWLSVANSIKGMLCIGCLEERLGRKLTKDDFTSATINSPRYEAKSQRLMERFTC
jgi:hypothetical protein